MKAVYIDILIFCITLPVAARESQREIDLRGYWKFETWDDKKFADSDFDDSEWEEIKVPSSWESRGFPGYDGYAWYRTTFDCPGELEQKSLMLKLGNIDDVDEVYLNGQFIGGMGTVEPEYVSAYSKSRSYPIPTGVLLFEEQNVVAVRVFDQYGPGGIIEGEIGVYSYAGLDMEVNLAGTWKLAFGDNQEWREINCRERAFKDIQVPANWESQGYQDKDGYAWYRKTFSIDKRLADEKLILAMGKIDDYDEVFFNGVQIGRTGRFPIHEDQKNSGNYYRKERIYRIPPHLVRWNGKNVIAVRVYDVWGDGGIYEGPVGVSTWQRMLEKEKEKRQKHRFILDEILQDVFDW
ncbi:beta galactosidase jelly roll domain-containing protein [candidate division KSB1 bacterium]|nr:beta galactosidase jelly roll domain-containing protein [candidate division KSB1 bacterium]